MSGKKSDFSKRKSVIPEQGSSGYITSDDLTLKVIEASNLLEFVPNDQIGSSDNEWVRSPDNKNGYFSLKETSSGKLLTLGDKGLNLTGRLKFLKIYFLFFSYLIS